MIKLILISILALFSTYSYAKSEAEYADEHCSSIGGVTEYVLPDRTRVDCLTDNDAIEYSINIKKA